MMAERVAGLLSQLESSGWDHAELVICDHTIDITYIRLRGGWMYLVAILDWFSRYVVSWELDQTLEMPFVLSAVERVLAQATPLIWNSDQGSHFTSPQYLERLLAANVQISMDGKQRALDNIFTERLWRTLKYEEVYLHDYAHPKEARHGLARYFEFYNFERPHQALDYQKETPCIPVSLRQGLSGAARSGCSPVLYPEGSQCILNMVSPVP